MGLILLSPQMSICPLVATQTSNDVHLDLYVVRFLLLQGEDVAPGSTMVPGGITVHLQWGSSLPLSLQFFAVPTSPFCFSLPLLHHLLASLNVPPPSLNVWAPQEWSQEFYVLLMHLAPGRDPLTSALTSPRPAGWSS